MLIGDRSSHYAARKAVPVCDLGRHNSLIRHETAHGHGRLPVNCSCSGERQRAICAVRKMQLKAFRNFGVGKNFDARRKYKRCTTPHRLAELPNSFRWYHLCMVQMERSVNECTKSSNIKCKVNKLLTVSNSLGPKIFLFIYNCPCMSHVSVK